jgi:hypothetical protein
MADIQIQITADETMLRTFAQNHGSHPWVYFDSSALACAEHVAMKIEAALPPKTTRIPYESIDRTIIGRTVVGGNWFESHAPFIVAKLHFNASYADLYDEWEDATVAAGPGGWVEVQ